MIRCNSGADSIVWIKEGTFFAYALKKGFYYEKKLWSVAGGVFRHAVDNRRAVSQILNHRIILHVHCADGAYPDCSLCLAFVLAKAC